MFNLLIAGGLAAVVFALVAAILSPLSAILPALLVFPLALYLLSMRTGRAVQAALAQIPDLAQAGKLDEIRALIVETRDTHKNWQLLLDRQLTAQLGMLDYAQMKFDEALPLLEQGWRDWSTTVAAGCVHYRRGRHDDAMAAFADAASYAPKEPSVYLVWATLASRLDRREEAVLALAKGLESLPDHPELTRLKKRVANKQKVDVDAFQQVWFQFFPEDAARRMTMRGARPGSMPDMPFPVRQQAGPPQPRTRGKLAKRR